ncbi:MAG TPA: hypothetical protein VER58_04490 [Thermoanaerobaculia bacterium]|nr:hypothetical protein [Thermoanaerobaculia bacterium]
MIFALALFAVAVDQPGKICPDPRNSKCVGWTWHDLGFATPKDEVARDEFRSGTFYAVVLKTIPKCSITRAQLADIQKLFPANKVFASRMGCESEEGSDEAISYTNVNAKVGFIAVYAGATPAQAAEFLKRVNATGKYPGANVRKMQAVLVYP